MIKKTVILVSAVLFFMIFAGQACAGNFDQLYTTDGYESTTLKTIFGWNDLPWLYAALSAASGSPLTVTSSWKSPGGTTYSAGNTLSDGKMWLYLEDWNSVKTAGLWNIDATYSYGGGSGIGSTTFTVTPEPVSVALFLFGGAVLAAGYRKKKTKFLKG